MLAAVDYLQMLLYVAAYICTVSWQHRGVGRMWNVASDLALVDASYLVRYR